MAKFLSLRLWTFTFPVSLWCHLWQDDQSVHCQALSPCLSFLKLTFTSPDPCQIFYLFTQFPVFKMPHKISLLTFHTLFDQLEKFVIYSEISGVNCMVQSFYWWSLLSFEQGKKLFALRDSDFWSSFSQKELNLKQVKSGHFINVLRAQWTTSGSCQKKKKKLVVEEQLVTFWRRIFF